MLLLFAWSDGSSDWMTKSRHSSKIFLTCCCHARGPCVSRIKLSLIMSIYSNGGPPVLSEEAFGVCGLKGCVVGSDSCAVPRQVAELVVVGCSTTSSTGCRSVALDVMLASLFPVLWVTYHTSYCERDDEPTLVLPTFPTPTDSWESYLVLHYWKSTKTSNSSTRLAYLLLYKTTLLSLAVEPSPIIPDPLYVILQSNLLRMHSLYVILLCFYLFQSPNLVVTKLGLFPLSYFITHLF